MAPRRTRLRPPFAALLVVVAAAAAGCVGGGPEPGVLRLGFLANLTHAQALYGTASGLFEERLGDVRLEVTVFSSGPVAVEALLAGDVDVIYVGPAPLLHLARSFGSERLRILAGAAEGGAALVLQEGVDVASPADLEGLRLAAPQIGNTQDIALRHYLLTHGLRARSDGGRVDVVTAANADILAMFRHRHGVDGAWVPEPWATRLVREAGGHVHLREEETWPDGRYVTTVLATTSGFLDTHREACDRLVAAHAEATERLARTDDALLATLNQGLEAAGGKALPDAVLREALANVRFTEEAHAPALEGLAERIESLGFRHGSRPDVGALLAGGTA